MEEEQNFITIAEEFRLAYELFCNKVDDMPSAELKRTLKAVIGGEKRAEQYIFGAGFRELEAIQLGLNLERLKLETFVASVKEEHERQEGEAKD